MTEHGRPGMGWPVRIADVAEFYAEQGGGVKTYLEAKLRAGAEAGHEITLVAPGPEDGETERDGGRVVWVKSPPVPGDPRYFLFTSKSGVHAALDRIQPEVVEGSSPYGGAWFAASWRGAKARSLVFHQDPVAALAHPLLDHRIHADRIDRFAFPVWSYLKRLTKRFDTTVVAGSWLANRLSQFGLHRVDSVPFGIDPKPFRRAKPDPELRRSWLLKLGLPKEGKVLVAVSRHHPEKRLPTLIGAVRAMEDRTPVGLIVFGDGPDRKRVERAAQGSARVWLAGYTRDRASLATALRTADAFLHGSAAETFGLVVSEALASGLPLILPDAGGAGELAHQNYAETYRAGNVGSCVQAIERMLRRADDAARQAEIAGGEVRTLHQHFDELFAHYRKLAAR